MTMRSPPRGQQIIQNYRIGLVLITSQTFTRQEQAGSPSLRQKNLL